MPVPKETADTLYNWLIAQTTQQLKASPNLFGLPESVPGEPGATPTIPSGSSSPTFPVGLPGSPGNPPGASVNPFGTPSPGAFTGSASYGAWNPNWDKYGTPASNAAGFGPWGGPNADGPPAWLASEALKAYQAGDQKRMKHLLDSATGPDGPKGSLGHHIVNFLTELFAGSQDRVKEAMYYQTNPSSGGIPNFGGTPGDFK